MAQKNSMSETGIMAGEADKGSSGHIRVREEINKDLKKEFDLLHALVTKELEAATDKDCLCSLISTQLSLAAQIVRESRALSGESSYAFPPHAFDD